MRAQRNQALGICALVIAAGLATVPARALVPGQAVSDQATVKESSSDPEVWGVRLKPERGRKDRIRRGKSS